MAERSEPAWLEDAEAPPLDPTRDARWDKLASGAYGAVWRCQQEPVVWKTWRTTESSAAAYLVAQAMRLRHCAAGWPASLCRLGWDTVVRATPGSAARVWLAMAYAGQPALDTLCPADEPQLRRDLLAAVDFLADRGLAHNDIFFRNILRAGPGAPFVLVDFDLVAELDCPGAQEAAKLEGFRAHPCAAALRAMSSEPEAAAIMATSLWQVGIACVGCLAADRPVGRGLRAIMYESSVGRPESFLAAAGLPLTVAQVAGAAPLAGDIAEFAPCPELRALLSDNPEAHRPARPRRDDSAGRQWWAGCTSANRTQFPRRAAWVRFAEEHIVVAGAFPVYTALLKIAFVAMADRMACAEVDSTGRRNGRSRKLARVLADFVADLYSPVKVWLGSVHAQPEHWRAIKAAGLPPLGMLFAGVRDAQREARALAVLALQSTPAGAEALYAALAQTGRPPADLRPVDAGGSS